MCARSLEHDNDVLVFLLRISLRRSSRLGEHPGDIKMSRCRFVRLRIIINPYLQQKAVVKVLQEYPEESDLRRGVRQGCMSLILLILCAEAMMIEAMKVIEKGFR